MERLPNMERSHINISVRQSFRRYKALLLPDGNNCIYNDNLPNPSKMIKRVHYQIAMAAVRAGTTLKRWCNSSSLVLKKQQGVSSINKLQVIHIFITD